MHHMGIGSTIMRFSTATRKAARHSSGKVANAVLGTTDAALIGSIRGGAQPAPPLAIYPDAVTQEEERALVAEAEQWFKPRSRSMPYLDSNADNLIFGYRELQKPLHAFAPTTRGVLERLISAIFPKGSSLMRVHLLDLAADGYILPHVDHTDYSGNHIVGLSLLTESVMTLHHVGSGVPDSGSYATWMPMRLPRRSLYVLTGDARFKWAHAVPKLPPKTSDSDPFGRLPAKGRRLAIILRDEAGKTNAPKWRRWNWRQDT